MANLHGNLSENMMQQRNQLIRSLIGNITVIDRQDGRAVGKIQEGLAEYNFSLYPEEVDHLNVFLKPIDIGPKRKALTIVIPITIVYTIIFITGIVGNICTCVVIIRNKYMRTVTNYYLFNLSVSDLLLLVMGLPHETYLTWHAYPYLLGEAFCRLRLLSAETSCYVSILTITAFTVERYMAICHPIRCPTKSGLSRPIRVILAVWVVSVLAAIPVGLQFGIRYHRWKDGIVPGSEICDVSDVNMAATVFQVSTWLFFVVPMSAISLLYFLIAVAIRRSTLNRGESDASLDSSHAHRTTRGEGAAAAISRWDRRRFRYDNKGPTRRQAVRWNGARKGVTRSGRSNHTRIRKSVLKMLVAVVVAFFLCWAPFHAQRLFYVYVKDRSALVLEVENALFYISGVTYYLSATINPILYSIMSLKFRQAFRSTLLGCCCFWSAQRRARRKPVRDPFVLKFSLHGRRPGTFPTHCTVVDSSGSANSNNNKKTTGAGGSGGGGGGGGGGGCSSDGSGGSGGRNSNGLSMDGSCHSGCRLVGNHSNQSSPGLCCAVESRPLVEMALRGGGGDHDPGSGTGADVRERGV